MFNWVNSLKTGEDSENLESFIVEFNNIFARHKSRHWHEHAMQSQSNADKLVYTENLPVLINLEEDLTVELALMHRYGIITTLPFSKSASPIFAQRNPNCNLRYWWTCRRSTPSSQTTTSTTTTLPAHSQMPRNTYQGKFVL